MAITVTHKKVATLPDQAGAEINKAEWNDTHQVTGLSTVAETGSYNDLTDKPTIPTVPSGLTPLGAANTFPTVAAGGSALEYTYATNQSLQTVDNVTFNSVTLPAGNVQTQLDAKVDYISYSYFGGI